MPFSCSDGDADPVGDDGPRDGPEPPDVGPDDATDDAPELVHAEATTTSRESAVAADRTRGATARDPIRGRSIPRVA